MLKNTIRNAFADVVYPGDDNLVVGSDLECVDVKESLKGKPWWSVTPENLRANAEALPLLTDAAFHYYLPAYMWGCIVAPDEVDVVLDSVLFNLTPPDERRGSEWQHFTRRAHRFTRNQAEAILSCLEFLQDRERAGWVDAGLRPSEDELKPAVEFWRQQALRGVQH